LRRCTWAAARPPFFSAENLKQLLEAILEKAEVTPEAEFSVEVHPNATNAAQLQVLYDLGFRRLSVGIQDFDPYVQLIINRIQTFEQTKETFDTARAIGYTSINGDIIYGLPHQTADSIRNSIEKVKELRRSASLFTATPTCPGRARASAATPKQICRSQPRNVRYMSWEEIFWKRRAI
jgi:oxygen-independent coproporphyrinogen-3 oxidase